MVFKPEKSKNIIMRSDEDLMVLIAAHNREAFNILYKRYAGRLLHFFKHLYQFNEEIAADRTQDVFLKLLEHASRFDFSRSFSTWLYAMAFNLYKNDMRKKETEQKFLAGQTQPMVSYFPQTDYLHDTHMAGKIVAEALNQLEPDVRSIFILRHLHEHSIPEISVIVSCPEGTVKSRLFYAMKKLSKQLEHLNISDWI